MKKVLVFIILAVMMCIGLFIIFEKQQTITKNETYEMYLLCNQVEKKVQDDALETVPFTDVWAQVKDKNSTMDNSYYIGSYVGGITEVPAEVFSDRELPDTTIAAFLCWYGGGGIEVYITKEPSSLHVFERPVYESNGTDEKRTWEVTEKNIIKMSDINKLTFEGIKE